jgi:hypothetical protein
MSGVPRLLTQFHETASVTQGGAGGRQGHKNNGLRAMHVYRFHEHVHWQIKCVMNNEWGEIRAWSF